MYSHVSTTIVTNGSWRQNNLPLSPAPSNKIFKILGRSLARVSNCLSISSLRRRASISSRSNVRHAPICSGDTRLQRSTNRMRHHKLHEFGSSLTRQFCYNPHRIIYTTNGQQMVHAYSLPVRDGPKPFTILWELAHNVPTRSKLASIVACGTC